MDTPVIANVMGSNESERKNKFKDLHNPLSGKEALVEAARCYYCFDAPCTNICPTEINVPLFIRQILADNAKGAAETILTSNIFGGMCARVCPTENLCEKECVRTTSSNKPVTIGLLQRFAVDHVIEADEWVLPMPKSGGKKVAVVGAGPAGVSCAHYLRQKGHSVDVFDAKQKAGGLNEYGLAAYKTPDGFAQKELNYILSPGGINLKTGVKLGSDIHLSELQETYDAVFLGLGLQGTNDLSIPGENLSGVTDAVDFISDIRQAEDLKDLSAGRNVVVIGGGMTAIDVAVQSKKIGAKSVTLVYRGDQDRMKASLLEQELALNSGVVIRHLASPVEIKGENGEAKVVRFEEQEITDNGSLRGTGEFFELPADRVFKAIGQSLEADLKSEPQLNIQHGRVEVDEERRTNVPKIWAGGDCIGNGHDLTVAAVQDGKIAAASIDAALGN